MALSSWWHKFPNFRYNDEENKNSDTKKVTEEYITNQIDEDFSNTLALFKNSIYNIENVSSIFDKTRKESLEELLDPGNIIPKDLQKFVSFLRYPYFYFIR